jgi:hypothetical protein
MEKLRKLRELQPSQWDRKARAIVGANARAQQVDFGDAVLNRMEE